MWDHQRVSGTGMDDGDAGPLAVYGQGQGHSPASASWYWCSYLWSLLFLSGWQRSNRQDNDDGLPTASEVSHPGHNCESPFGEAAFPMAHLAVDERELKEVESDRLDAPVIGEQANPGDTSTSSSIGHVLLQIGVDVPKLWRVLDGMTTFLCLGCGYVGLPCPSCPPLRACATWDSRGHHKRQVKRSGQHQYTM